MGTYLTPTIIAKEALIVLENNLVLAGLVHRDYSKEYKKIGSTVIVRKPTTFTSTTVSNTVNLSTATESSVAVVLDKHLDVTFNVSSQELSLTIVDFSEQLIQPAMRAHAQAIDAYLAALYVDIPNFYTVTSTAVAADIAHLREVLNLNGAPMEDRRCVLHPSTEAAYVSLDAFLHADKKGSTDAIKEAHMGRVMGMDFYMDQNIKTHTGGDMADVTGAMKGALAVGDGTATIDAITSGGTVLAGDCFKITGYPTWGLVSTTATASAATITVVFTPVVDRVIATTSVVNFTKTHKANLAFHKNAFALVTAPLAPPIGGAGAAVLEYKGLSARVVYDYTMMTKQNLISIDLLCGVKTLDPKLAARFVDSTN